MTVHEFYRQIQEWIGDRLLVDKTPGYAMRLDAMKRIEDYFQDAYYIHLMRHPYGMIQSYIEARLDLLVGQQLQDNLHLSRREIAELTWTSNVANILEVMKEIPAQRQLTVKFEDLASQPQATCEQICRFLGLDFHHGMIEPYREKEQRMTEGVYPQGIMLGDMKFHQHKQIDPQVADHWRRHITADFLSEPTRELAHTLGYKLLDEA